MSIRDTLATLFRHPPLEFYRCGECGSHLGEDDETCPDCGAEEVVASTQNDLLYYWGGL